MGFGFCKSFAIFLVLAVLLGYATNNYWNGLVLIIIYAGVKIVWTILTK